MKADDQARIVEDQARAIWDSLQSHLDGMYLKSPEGKRFHKKCVKDYALQLYKLTKLL